MVPIVPRTFAEVGMEVWAGIFFFLFFGKRRVGRRCDWKVVDIGRCGESGCVSLLSTL